ncbi:MAG: NAD(P)/FAD-dependent oxidoreductase, partial [Acetanaerobacterium sp.]
TNIEVMTDTMVLDIAPDKTVRAVNSKDGYMELHAKAVVLAMGCRERTRGAVAIPGDRPAGVFTAGTAQLYVNIHGYMVGRRVIILGSGDIGLIMARRMTLEGATVLGCVELMPYSGGLARNIVQCLDDYNIPLYLSHTITSIKGDKRVEHVTVAKVDENRRPIAGTEIEFDCDTVLLSVGLIPENELSRGAGLTLDARTGGLCVYENMESSVPGVFAGGNVVHVHDLVDFVTGESQRAGRAAANFAAGKQTGDAQYITVSNGEGVGYTVPQRIRPLNVQKTVELFFRVKNSYKDVRVMVSCAGQTLASYKREHMAPGEMEKIMLPKALLDKAQSNEIIISIEQGSAG